MCLMQDFPPVLLKIIEIWPKQQIYKKNLKFSQKKYVFSILKLKTAKNSQRIFFAEIDKNFKLPPNFSKIYQNISKKRKKIKSKLILIYTVLNQK
jgi:hypothetical protein